MANENEGRGLDPITPREYREACRRILTLFEELWDELPDGDGDKGSGGDTNQTKTDFFIILAGCADYGKAAIKIQNELKALVDTEAIKP